MKIYTKTGDRGETGLVGGSRISKNSERIATIGDIDELNASIGVARTENVPEILAPTLEWLQSALFDLGAEIASPPGSKISFAILTNQVAIRLEEDIDRQTAALEPLRNFILPGGSNLAAQLHLARCVCRRAERSALALHEKEALRPEVLAFLNRLSDWLFVAARTANKQDNRDDVPWQGRQASG